MVLTSEEEKELLAIKQDHKKEIGRLENADAEKEHIRKMLRLDKLLEIAKAGGIGFVEK